MSQTPQGDSLLLLSICRRLSVVLQICHSEARQILECSSAEWHFMFLQWFLCLFWSLKAKLFTNVCKWRQSHLCRLPLWVHTLDYFGEPTVTAPVPPTINMGSTDVSQFLVPKVTPHLFYGETSRLLTAASNIPPSLVSTWNKLSILLKCLSIHSCIGKFNEEITLEGGGGGTWSAEAARYHQGIEWQEALPC